jgi:DNA-binding FadR family transcriptional regulator
MSATEVPTGELVQRIVERTVYTPVREGSAVAGTVERLGRAIGMGLLRPGDRLPPESRLAEDLRISPVTLRNALTILRGAGLLETQRGRAGGTRVSANTSAELVAGADALPTEASLNDLADYRLVVEGGAAALAARRATAEQLGYLERLAAEMLELGDFESWSERDTLFHLIVADASGSQRIVTQVAEIRAEVYRVAKLGAVPQPTVELADREHAELLRAIAARRPEPARKAMERHVESTRALWLGLGRAAGEKVGAGGARKP